MATSQLVLLRAPEPASVAARKALGAGRLLLRPARRARSSPQQAQLRNQLKPT